MCSNKPEISIIVCIYNAEKFLRRCLDSLRNQTMSDFEVLAVDDGSTDGSGDICMEYAAYDCRFRHIPRNNGGANAARATGLQYARGRYICFVDSDDYIEPDYLIRLHDAITAHNADIAICGYVEEYAGYSVERPESRDFFAFWNKIFRREVFDGLTLPSIPYAEDILVFAQIYDRKPKIVSITDILYHWIQNENAERLSLSFSKGKYRKGMMALAETGKLIRDRNTYEEFRMIFTTLYAFKCVVFDVFTPREFRKEFKGCLGMFMRSRQPARRKLMLLTHYIGLSEPLRYARNIYVRHLKKLTGKK